MARRNDISKQSKKGSERRKEQLERANPGMSWEVVKRGDLYGVRFSGRRSKGDGDNVGSISRAGIADKTAQQTCQAKPQNKAQPNQAVTQRDKAPANRKTPKADLGEKQRIASTGETVPIVFCKRVNDVGGAWIQPSLARSGTDFFKGSFLFPISQGEIVSSPVKHRIWVGLRNMAFLEDQTITISHIYNSTATLAASPSTCPILGAGLYCGNETYSYVTAGIGTSGTYTERRDNSVTTYQGYRTIARGFGDTTNSVIRATFEVFDNVTGADLTAAWFAQIGFPVETEFAFNLAIPGSATPCTAVGDIEDWTTYLGFSADPQGFHTAIGSSGSYTIVWTVQGTDDQYDINFPASTGTLESVQFEYIESKYPDPTSTPTADNSSFADITFLKVVGDIYERPAEGSYPTETRQISVYYEQGVSVDLYSVDTTGSTQGASNQLVDLVMYLLNIFKRSSNTDPNVSAPIDTANMPDLATFCDEYNLHFNGVISDSLNIIDFISETAPYFFLSFQSNGGQYRFEPLLPLNGSQQIDGTALTPAATFTEAEILPGSFKKAYVAAEEKTDINAVVLYRLNNPETIGIEQAVQVRYDGVSLDVPVEQFDMSDFCANRDHAIIFAKYFLAKRKHSLHSISFSIPLSTDNLKPTDIIKIERSRINTAGDDRTEIEWYQIVSINYAPDGETSIDAIQFPVDGSNVAKISDDVLNASFAVV